MSINRTCKCGEQEAIRFNFGDDRQSRTRISQLKSLFVLNVKRMRNGLKD